MKNNKINQPFEMKVENGRLQISIGVSTLCNAIEDAFIVNEDDFMRLFYYALATEDKKGNNIIQQAFLNAAYTAIENGA